MKQHALLLFMILLTGLNLQAQITIDESDMPTAGDSVKYSTATNADQFDFVATGANYNWDFEALSATAHTYDGYVSISESPALFQLIFNPFVANLASKRPDLNLFTITLENGYTYYKTSSSTFQEVGFGTEINGAPIPVSYSSPDVIYALPLSYQKNYASQSSYNFQLPGMGSLSQVRQRSSVVDGWGTVTTPYGSFECLRIASTVYQEDSIFIDALPIPIPALPRTYTEYIWLSKKEHFPILKAVDNGLLGLEVTYIDSTNYFEELLDPEVSLQYRIYPNPSSDYLAIETNQDSFRLDIYDIRGTRVFSRANTSQKKMVFDITSLAAGMYFVRIESRYFTETTKIIIH